MGKAKKSTTSESVPQPKLADYLRAINQLFADWLGRHMKLVVMVLVVLLGVSGWFGYQVLQDRAELTNDEIVTLVNQRLGITNDTNPAVLDVVDEQKVTQPFLDSAQNGDKVLLYYKADKSVLFRPDGEQIVREGTFTPPDAKVFIRDSENDQAAVDELSRRLEELSGIDIVSRDKTSNSYDKILIVNITDRYPAEAEAIADELDSEVVRLPKGESIPDSDILIIHGR